MRKFFKTASINFFKSVGSALKGTVLGGKSLGIKGTVMLKERTKAQRLYNNLSKSITPHRARIKTEESIVNNLSKNKKIDDLLGIQVYSKTPKTDIPKIVGILKNNGIKYTGVNAIKKPGYVGINMKGVKKGVPIEVQLSPGKLSNFGQILQHDAYKPPKNFTPWDKKMADTVGKLFVNSGTKKWGDVLNYAK